MCTLFFFLLKNVSYQDLDDYILRGKNKYTGNYFLIVTGILHMYIILWYHRLEQSFIHNMQQISGSSIEKQGNDIYGNE